MALGLLRLSSPKFSITWVKNHLWGALQSPRCFCEAAEVQGEVQLPRSFPSHHGAPRGEQDSSCSLWTWKKPQGLCFHQSGYSWANNVQKAQAHLCYKIDKMSGYASAENLMKQPAASVLAAAVTTDRVLETLRCPLKSSCRLTAESARFQWRLFYSVNSHPFRWHRSWH